MMYNINLGDVKIKQLNIEGYKVKVNNSIRDFVFQELIEKVSTEIKLKDLLYVKLEYQKYLDNISPSSLVYCTFVSGVKC